MKSVVQTIPVYTMGLFKLPKGVVHDLNRILANFWWGGSEKGRKVHWRKLDTLCKPKSKGGLRFRDFEVFNQVMLAKQAWRIFQKLDSLVAKVLKAKYFHSTDFMKCKVGCNASYVWRSIVWGKELLDKGLVKRIGNGETTKVYKDKWLPRPALSNQYHHPLYWLT